GIVKGVRAVGDPIEPMMEMAAARALIAIWLGHERGSVAVLAGDLLDAMLERKGRIGGRDIPVGREVNLLLAGTIVGVGGDDIYIDGLEVANNLANERAVEVVPQSGEDLNAGIRR